MFGVGRGASLRGTVSLLVLCPTAASVPSEGFPALSLGPGLRS